MTDTPFRLFNSLTRQLEEFRPVHPGEARVYSCGPTVYNYPHIGNMRAYIFADVLGRVLRWKGYDLTHIINITDVGHLTDDADKGDDKLERMAAKQQRSIWDIARYYTEAFKADVRALNIREPAEWTVATDYVPQMIDFAKGIADKHCYEIDSGLYFDVTTVPDYGRLARARTEEGEGRIEEVAGKRNAADFAIWRRTLPGETRQMEWDSPWGRGAPGWHLECSVMSGAVLGFPFDIHTGGIDHREIHHPNEIAQNQAHCGSLGGGCADSGVRIWMHNNFLVDRTGKMSKSSGEFLTLRTLVDRGYHPLAYRLMCLQAHYRSELEFTWEGLHAALVRLRRMVGLAEVIQANAPSFAKWTSDFLLNPKHSYASLLEHVSEAPFTRHKAQFMQAINEDLNMPDALVSVEGTLRNNAISYPDRYIAVTSYDAILGLDLLNLTRADLRIRPKDAQLTEGEVETMLARRKEARAAKDFATSDAIRGELATKGVEVMDGDPLGWEWRLI